MIKVSFTTACLLYLSLLLLGIFIIGLRFHLKKKDRQKMESSSLHLCEYCQHAYLDDIDQTITKCPKCQLLNKKEIEALST